MATLERENQARLNFDAASDHVTAHSYNAYANLLPVDAALFLTPTVIDGRGTAKLFETSDSSYTIAGNDVEFDLASYSIQIVHQDGKFLVPLQTLNDLVPMGNGMALLYNGENLYAGGAGRDLAQAAFSAPAGERSKQLAEYGYKELCLLLDSFCGLKATHDITTFGDLFERTGFSELLTSTDAQVADNALVTTITYLLNDVHSSPESSSYLSGKDFEPDVDYFTESNARVENDRAEEEFKKARAERYGENVPSYEEFGDTAFVTFDNFLSGGDAPEGVPAEAPGVMGDTFDIIVYAHSQITRKDSPIKNVVLDMSCNTGGDVSAAVYTLAWMLGESSICTTDEFTGAIAVENSRADVNLDEKFTEEDTLDGYRLYCLISPVSFSCGNLVPSVLKASNRVTLVGRTSAGGSCVVSTAMTAWGAAFNYSGRSRINTMKNGSVYDVDRGVDPEVNLTNPASYYDRAVLADYLRGIK